MISIIVPVYNTEKYLDRCIQSILAQTYTEFELLLIDDGSTDSSGAICDKYAAQDSRVRVFHKPNGGVSSARNLGLDNARGEWVTFCDSDDKVLPTFLENYVELDGDLKIQGLMPYYESSTGFLWKKFGFDYKCDVKGCLFWLIETAVSGSLWTKLFKLSIIRNNRLKINELYRYREDEEFLLRYLQYAKTIHSTSKAGYIYTVSGCSKYNGIDNIPILVSMYKSVVAIFNGKPNSVTDFYQIQLFEEWLKELKLNNYKAIKLLPQILRTVGWRIYRLAPLSAAFKKILTFIQKTM